MIERLNWMGSEGVSNGGLSYSLSNPNGCMIFAFGTIAHEVPVGKGNSSFKHLEND